MTANFRGVIISGGPGVGTAESADQLKETVFKLDVPILGICFGNQVRGLVLYCEFNVSCSNLEQ